MSGLGGRHPDGVKGRGLGSNIVKSNSTIGNRGGKHLGDLTLARGVGYARVNSVVI